MKKRITVGILAHVDAGKTTLSEALLFVSGKIRKQGRVDHKNTYLDTNAVERERGITVFSKQARFSQRYFPANPIRILPIRPYSAALRGSQAA